MGVSMPADCLARDLPDVAKQQERVKNAIESAVKAAGCAEIVHRREWLGYLPFGAYHWIVCAGHDVEDLPFDFTSDDLAAIEYTGFLEKTGERTNPRDEFDSSTFYRVHPIA